MDGKQHHQEDKRVPKTQQRESGQVGSAWQSDMLPAGMAPQQGLQGLPAGAGAQAMRQAAALKLQRQSGNAVVQRVLADKAPAVQRAGDDGDLPLLDPTSSQSGAGGTSGAQALTSGPSQVKVNESEATIDAPMIVLRSGQIVLDAPLTSANGALDVDTLIADNVVGTNYTPGVGNQQ